MEFMLTASLKFTHFWEVKHQLFKVVLQKELVFIHIGVLCYLFVNN